MCVNTCKDREDFLLVKREFGKTEICPDELTNQERQQIQNISMLEEVKGLLREMLENARLTNSKMIEIIRNYDCPSDIKEKLIECVRSYPNTRDRANCIKWCVESLGKKFDKDVISLAASVEMIHLAMIITDNLFDGTQSCGGIKNPHERWGNEVAYIIAEIFISIALKNIIDTFGSHQNFSKIIGALVDAIKENYVAENMDFSLQKSHFATYSEYIELARKLEGKPLRYSIESALYLIDADEEEIKKLGEYGEILGIMFKIRNDIFDMVGHKDAIGKEPGEDINGNNLEESKKTLPIIFYLMKRRRRTPNNKNQIIQAIQNNGIIKLCEAELERYYIQAIEKLYGIPENSGKRWLEKFVWFVGNVFSLKR
jgi:geranylgeranyl pyrophosphate synthase